jgi:hypothetical protein
MNNWLRTTTVRAHSVARERPHETGWRSAVLSLASSQGWGLGGVGIAALGGALALAGLIAFPVAIGCREKRIGIGRDKKAVTKKA